MEALNLILLLAIFIILIVFTTQIKTKFISLESRLNRLMDKINSIEKRLLNQEFKQQNSSDNQVSEKQHKEAPLTASPIEESIIEQSEKAEQKPLPEPTPEKVSFPKKTWAPQPEPEVQYIRKRFSEKYPDLERFIGENLINKIGIVILVLGLGFLVKYAIDKNWINETGRVAIGILSAGALIGLAHKLRVKYRSFSSVLIGGGLAVLYFTITIAYHTEGYPLFEKQIISTIILVLITIFAVLLSIVYNRIELAILAILGGFGSPLMTSMSAWNYILLFSYLLLLNIGMLVLSYFKRWRLVNIVSFAFTMILFASWLIPELFISKHESFIVAIAFATAFYLIFFFMNIIYNLKNKIQFKAGDISLILSNTFIYFSLVMLMLNEINDGAYKGLFSVLLGVFNFCFAYYIHRKKISDTNLLFLLIGLVLTFITLSIPLQLNGNYITLFWSIEGVLLLWLGQKSGFKILKLGSLLVSCLMLISIGMDWNINYDAFRYAGDDYVKEMSFIFNKMFVTTLVSVSALIASLSLLKKEKDKFAWLISAKGYSSIILGLIITVFYVGAFLEVLYHSAHYFSLNTSYSIALYAYNAIFMLLLIALAHKLNNKVFSIIASAITGIFIFIFLKALSNQYSNNILELIRGEESARIFLLILRWISICAVYVYSWLLLKLVNNINEHKRDILFKLNISVWVFAVIFMLSADLDSIVSLIANSKSVLLHTQKTGYAVLWGISSLILMIVGMKRKEKFVRIISLALFAITIIKLFVYDISNITEGGKIIAFILLGILLLIISFMYQKVKRLVTDDDYLNSNNTDKTSLSNE